MSIYFIYTSTRNKKRETMTNSVNRITATENEVKFGATNTAANTEKTVSASSGASASTTSYSDDVSYSVVCVHDAPDDLNEMKDVLNRCITSYDDMANYVDNLKGKNENLFVKINTKSCEISDISTDDGTGSGINSAYSLDLPEGTSDKDKSKTDNTQQEQAKSKEAKRQARTEEIQAKINTKQTEADSLSNKVSQNSDELNMVSDDMKENENTINKILEKVGGDTSHINGMMRYANGGAVVGATAGLDPVSSTVAGFFGLSSIFGGGKAKKKAEVIQLAKEAFRAERKVSRALNKCSNTVQISESLSNDMNNKLKEKQDAVETK